MTFQQYIDNPLGKKNAVFSQRDMYKQLYTQKWDAILLREAGKIKYHLYHNRKADVYYAHILVPSEVVPKFYYDVVIKFFTSDNGIRAGSTLKDYDVAFFSNDPAFVFTYERVFHKNKMFIEELSKKASKLALRKDPKEKNPYMVPGYVKSIYFAFLFMRSKNLFSKALYDQEGEETDGKVRKLLGMITPTDEKIAKRQELGAEEAKKKGKEKRSVEQRQISHTKAQIAIDAGKRNTVSNIKVTDKVRSVAKVGKVGVRKPSTKIGFNKKP